MSKFVQIKVVQNVLEELKSRKYYCGKDSLWIQFTKYESISYMLMC